MHHRCPRCSDPLQRHPGEALRRSHRCPTHLPNLPRMCHRRRCQAPPLRRQWLADCRSSRCRRCHRGRLRPCRRVPYLQRRRWHPAGRRWLHFPPRRSSLHCLPREYRQPLRSPHPHPLRSRPRCPRAIRSHARNEFARRRHSRARRPAGAARPPSLAAYGLGPPGEDSTNDTSRTRDKSSVS